MNELKPGKKTTEFMLTVATLAGQLAAAIAGGLPATWTAATSSALVVGYAFARSYIKASKTDALTDAKV